MTNQEIIDMARDVGMSALIDCRPGWAPEIVALVNKAAAKEREACAQIVQDTTEWRAPGWVSTICPITKGAIASAIRARGQA